MSCDCHTIGCSFMDGVDPSCPRHGRGGTEEQEDRIDTLQSEVSELKKIVRDLQNRIRRLEDPRGRSSRS